MTLCKRESQSAESTYLANMQSGRNKSNRDMRAAYKFFIRTLSAMGASRPTFFSLGEKVDSSMNGVSAFR